MNRFFNVIIKSFYLLLVLILSGCSTYPSSYSLHTQALQKLNPHYVSVHHGQIEYYKLGKGSPIVLISGYVTDVTSWDRHFLAALAREHQLIILNNRNVGGSIIHSSHYESRDLANDDYQLIQALGLKKPAVLGYSMGGMIAQQLAVLHSNELGQLILINTAPPGNLSVHPCPVIEKKLLFMPENKLGRFALALELFFPPSWRTQMAYEVATQRFQPHTYTEVDPAAIKPPQRHLLFHWAKENETAQKLKKLNLPTLILNGESDIVIPPVNSIILAKTIPHARLVRWKEGGHGMIYQFPVQIADVINAFIIS